jgi:hypothetical protein
VIIRTAFENENESPNKLMKVLVEENGGVGTYEKPIVLVVRGMLNFWAFFGLCGHSFGP